MNKFQERLRDDDEFRHAVAQIYNAGFADGREDGLDRCEHIANMLTIQPPRKWAQELEKRMRNYIAKERIRK